MGGGEKSQKKAAEKRRLRKISEKGGEKMAAKKNLRKR
jgi:hypothetical protein